MSLRQSSTKMVLPISLCLCNLASQWVGWTTAGSGPTVFVSNPHSHQSLRRLTRAFRRCWPNLTQRQSEKHSPLCLVTTSERALNFALSALSFLTDVETTLRKPWGFQNLPMFRHSSSRRLD